MKSIFFDIVKYPEVYERSSRDYPNGQTQDENEKEGVLPKEVSENSKRGGIDLNVAVGATAGAVGVVVILLIAVALWKRPCETMSQTGE